MKSIDEAKGFNCDPFFGLVKQMGTNCLSTGSVCLSATGIFPVLNLPVHGWSRCEFSQAHDEQSLKFVEASEQLKDTRDQCAVHRKV